MSERSGHRHHRSHRRHGKHHSGGGAQHDSRKYETPRGRKHYAGKGDRERDGVHPGDLSFEATAAREERRQRRARHDKEERRHRDRSGSKGADHRSRHRHPSHPGHRDRDRSHRGGAPSTRRSARPEFSARAPVDDTATATGPVPVGNSASKSVPLLPVRAAAAGAPRSHSDRSATGSASGRGSASGGGAGSKLGVGSLSGGRPAVASGKDLEQVHHFICQQIAQRTTKDADIQRRVFALFGRPTKGLTLGVFKQYLHQNFGIMLSMDDAKRLFKRYDVDGSGSVSLMEFVQMVIQKDYTRTPWAVTRQNEDRAKAAALAASGTFLKPYLDELPPSMQHDKRTGAVGSTAELMEALKGKILERIRRPADQYRIAYKLFGNPRAGISLENFTLKLRALGLVVTDEDAAKLMEVIDVDKSGSIDFNELVSIVLGADFEGKTWVERRDEGMRAERAAVGWEAPVSKEWPASLKHERPSVEEYAAQIGRKIIARTKRPEDQYRESYALFGSPHDGVTFPIFRQHIGALGMVISDEDARAVFKHLDRDASGAIDFPELISGVMPPDYVGEQWSVAKQKEYARRNAERLVEPIQPALTAYPPSMQKNKVQLADVPAMLYTKIVERTRRPMDMYRAAYKMFGQPRDGLSLSIFQKKLSDLGIILTPDESETIFNRFDRNENGKIEFNELLKSCMPIDFSLPLWNVESDAKARAHAHKMDIDSGAESPFGVAKVPGWEGTTSFGIEPDPTSRSNYTEVYPITASARSGPKVGAGAGGIAAASRNASRRSSSGLTRAGSRGALAGDRRRRRPPLATSRVDLSLDLPESAMAGGTGAGARARSGTAGRAGRAGGLSRSATMPRLK